MKLRQVIATVVGIGIVAGVSVVGAPYVATWYWHWQSSRDASTDPWASCEDPGAASLFRAVVQDRPIDCPMDAWLGWLQEDLTRFGARSWADEVLLEPSVSPLARMRLNFALWQAFDRSPQHLPALVDSDAIPPEERQWMWAWLGQQDVLPSWVDVALAEDVIGASFVADEDKTPEQGLAWLWRGMGAPGSLAPVLRSAAVEHVSAELESAAPMSVERPVCAVDTDACITELITIGEISLQADARSWDGGPSGTERMHAVPELSAASALWRAKYPDDGSSRDAAAWWLQAVASWASVPRDTRVLAVLASPVASELGASVDPGQWGDPAAVLGNRHGSPWATALAAVTLGQTLDESVSIAKSGDGVEISFADVHASVDGCGRVGVSAGVGEAITEHQVLARAAVEAAGDALQRGDLVATSRLLGLAERSDADAFAGFTQAVAADASDSAARTLGMRIGRTRVLSPQAEEWRDAWTALPADGCPPQVP